MPFKGNIPGNYSKPGINIWTCGYFCKFGCGLVQAIYINSNEYYEVFCVQNINMLNLYSAIGRFFFLRKCENVYIGGRNFSLTNSVYHVLNYSRISVYLIKYGY